MTHPYRERPPADRVKPPATPTRLAWSSCGFALVCGLLGQALAGPWGTLLFTAGGVLLLLLPPPPR